MLSDPLFLLLLVNGNGACRQFAPLIEEAARRKPDLVVLGETLTYAGVNSTYADCAESIPGPSTEFIEMAIPSGTRR